MGKQSMKGSISLLSVFIMTCRVVTKCTP